MTALAANLGIAVSKFVAAEITGSASMLAEGVLSVADSANQGLLLVEGRRARRDATASHPFGYHPERPVRDTGTDPTDPDRVAGRTGVDRINHLRTMHLGPDDLLVAAKIGVGPDDDASDISATIDATKARIRQAVPNATIIYLEPDIYCRDAQTT